MLPRKRQRQNSGAAPAADSGSSTPRPHASSTTSLPVTASEQKSPNHQMTPGPARADEQQLIGASGETQQKQVRKSKSWYGSWPRPPKATASTSVARENIFGGSVRTNKAPDLARFDTIKDSDASSLRSTTRANSGLTKIPENGAAHMAADDSLNPEEPKPDTQQSVESSAKPLQSPLASEATATPHRPASSPGWWGWVSKTPFTETQVAPMPPPSDCDEPSGVEPTQPSTPIAQTAPTDTRTQQDAQESSATSWLGFWPSSSKVGSEAGATNGPKSDDVAKDESAKEPQDVDMQDAPPATPAPPPKPEPAPKAGSTWAFWSRDSPKSTGVPVEAESGHLAVIGEGSEAHPKAMMEDSVSNTPSKDPDVVSKQTSAQASSKSTWRKNNKRLRPPSMDIDASATPSPSPSGTSTPQPPATETKTSIPVKADAKAGSESETSTKSPPNLLLPSFTSTYQMKENPSIIKQVAQFLMRTQQPPANHVYRVKEPPRIRKAIAIGVHGLFPATYLRPMIGQPTGTSLRFAGLCADAIRKWADEHGCSDCEIEKVALEGEGKINERVDNLWKLMLNWMEQIRSADLIIMACHSQGVPVSIMLLEKLIDLGIITNARIGVCAMAGVSLGPFPDYKSGIFMGSAAELWDFGNPQSNNAQRFEAALKQVLAYGTRITFIGSIDDQVVPLESAVYSPAHHPNIYRAVFIDGRIHAPDFIAHLVGFALKLRNLGVSDHGLIRELSVPLAGSLYSGEGHSRLYYESAVYDLAVSHALETTSVGPNAPPCEIRRPQGDASVVGGSASQPNNPYLLPWIMRGLLEEDFVKTELSSETEVLLKQFDDWKPSNKALKDVKYRLEAVRSKL